MVAIPEKALYSVQEKLRFKWKGPYRVTETVSRHVYVVENLVNKSTQKVHVSRLHYFDDSSLEIDANLLDQIEHDGFLYQVDKLVALEHHDDGYYMEVKWVGFSSEENTLEPVSTLYCDVPSTVVEFLKELATPESRDLLQQLEEEM